MHGDWNQWVACCIKIWGDVVLRGRSGEVIIWGRKKGQEKVKQKNLTTYH